MSVRVVARIRPLLKHELDKDTIVCAESAEGQNPTTVRIPNPKNDAETFTFQFGSVYEENATQQQLFENEVGPTVKHLFNGYDACIFAYGVTGTGKTHTMRGGKSLADRGVIPRLLSNIYRRCRKIEKDAAGATQVDVSLSYFEIYCDRVYDLFEPPEKRTPSGLPIRDNHGKTVVVGLKEMQCSTLKEFEHLYDQANINRSTSATKLNAHSSRSHAVLCVKITQTTESTVRVSQVSAIDLAGSEDNRRTDNNKERLIESSAINKSLFVLAQCVEAISKKQSRIPYRESKMTRILSLGQNNGMTLMILNIAPTRSYHLDTLSSLNFANRTKKIEVNEVENEPIFRNITKPLAATSIGGASQNQGIRRTAGAPKRPAESSTTFASRPTKTFRAAEPAMTKESIEALITRRIDEKLAEKALQDASTAAPALSAELQKRLDDLENRIDAKDDDGKAPGLQFLLMAKQHQVRQEHASALRMYRMAMPYFPGNKKLEAKMQALEERIKTKSALPAEHVPSLMAPLVLERGSKSKVTEDEDFAPVPESDNESSYESDSSFKFKSKRKPKKATKKLPIFRDSGEGHESSIPSSFAAPGEMTPRTTNLLKIINSRDVSKIRALKGVGVKKADAIVGCLLETEDEEVRDLEGLAQLNGVGRKTVENMRSGIIVDYEF